jgi:hypothetical protein
MQPRVSVDLAQYQRLVEISSLSSLDEVFLSLLSLKFWENRSFLVMNLWQGHYPAETLHAARTKVYFLYASTSLKVYAEHLP